MKFYQRKYIAVIILGVLTEFLCLMAVNTLADAYYGQGSELLTPIVLFTKHYPYMPALYIVYIVIQLLLLCIACFAAHSYAKPKYFTVNKPIITTALLIGTFMLLDAAFALYGYILTAFVLTSLIRNKKRLVYNSEEESNQTQTTSKDKQAPETDTFESDANKSNTPESDTLKSDANKVNEDSKTIDEDSKAINEDSKAIDEDSKTINTDYSKVNEDLKRILNQKQDTTKYNPIETYHIGEEYKR